MTLSRTAAGDRPIWQWSAVEQAEAIRRRELSCVDVVGAAVARMRAANPPLNAVTVDCGDDALREAQAADRALREGAAPGPLFGVPVTIKENVDVKGQATPNGVPAFADLIAPDDAPVVRNLRRAGAIVIGRTNTPEFSFRATTDNPLRGLTRNPWDPEITCGGSSGGAGASVAAGIGAIAHGNDIGGSLRFPAYCNGVATVKPTQGRIPAFNPSATAERPMLAQLMSTQGPIAREVRDVRAGLAAMAQADPRDPWWVPAPLPEAASVAGLKVAIPKDLARRDVHPAVADALAQAAEHLRAAGCIVETVDTPDIDRPYRLWWNLTFTEMKALQDAAMRPVISPAMTEVLDGYYAIAQLQDLAGYAGGLAERTGLLRRWTTFLAEWPIVLTPLSLVPPPAWDVDVGGRAAIEPFFDALVYQAGLNFLGLPSVVVPVTLHAGVPVGVQLIGGRYQEARCLDAGQAIEDRVGLMAQRLWARG